jgi:hypothetical protein
MNWTTTVNNDITSAGNGGISKLRSGMGPLSSEIAVDISVETIVTGRLQNQTTVPSKVQIAAEILDGILVSPVWIVDIPRTHMNGHRYIWMHVLSEKV